MQRKLKAQRHELSNLKHIEQEVAEEEAEKEAARLRRQVGAHALRAPEHPLLPVVGLVVLLSFMGGVGWGGGWGWGLNASTVRASSAAPSSASRVCTSYVHVFCEPGSRLPAPTPAA